MKFLVEGSEYTRKVLKTLLDDSIYSTVIQEHPGKDTQVLSCVGYCLSKENSTHQRDHIFLLPKVFRFGEGEKLFGSIPIPADKAIEFDSELYKQLEDDGWKPQIIEEFSMYLYQSIEKFRKTHSRTSIAYQADSSAVMSSKKDNDDRTTLDTVLALRDFYKENPDLFVLVYKQAHSGYNKVNWSKTIRNKTPLISGREVVYLEVVNFKKEINYDEELMVLFFSTLQYLHKKYNFGFKFDQPYELIPEKEYARRLSGGILKKRLEAIRNFYFNERLLKLWELLHIFVDKEDKTRHGKTGSEFLLACNYNIVFEAMIDDILCDKATLRGMEALKNQPDGKIIDHIFRGQSVLGDSKDILYIGDSKYYKDGSKPEGASLFKQYTYAKNIIQQEIDWYHQGDERSIRYRDDLTEGYNLTPNFFIRGFIDKDHGYNDNGLEEIGKEEDADFTINYQFANRIFDRDTLFLRQYELNFLFVLQLYVSKSQSDRERFQTFARGIFKKNFISYVKAHYDFFVLSPKDGRDLTKLVREKYFWDIHGKVFAPYSDEELDRLLILGLERPEESMQKEKFINLKGSGIEAHNRDIARENSNLLIKLEQDFYIKEYTLGEEPYICYDNMVNGQEQNRRLISDNGVVGNLSQYKKETVLVGCYRSPEHLEWILKNRLYNLCFDKYRKGNVYADTQNIFTAAYLFLYNYSNSSGEVKCFSLSSEHKILGHSDLESLGYPFAEGASPDNEYFIYHLGEGIECSLSVKDIVPANTLSDHSDGSPIFLPFSEKQT